MVPSRTDTVERKIASLTDYIVKTVYKLVVS